MLPRRYTIGVPNPIPDKSSVAADQPVRSFQDIVHDINARRNAYLTTIGTNDQSLDEWRKWVSKGKSATDQPMYLSPLTEGDLIETRSGNVAVILEVPDHIKTFSYSIVDHQGAVSLANASDFVFRIPQFCTTDFPLASTIRVVDDSDPAHPVVSITKNTREILCPNIKAVVESSQEISEKVATELDNIFLEVQESADPVNVSLFEVAWYVEQALIERSKQGNAYLARTLKLSPKERYSSLKGVFPPQSGQANSKKEVSNDVLYAVFTAVRTKFSTKVLFDNNERFTPTILTLIPFSLENEHNRAVDSLRNSTMRHADPLVKDLEKVVQQSDEPRSSSSPKSSPTTLNRTNQEMINLIKRYAVGDLSSTDFSSLSLVAMFLRKFSKYSTRTINSSVAFEFLQDISVFKKWDNPFRSQSKLLPLEVETQKIALEAEKVSIPDKMSSLRQDFDLPVYCIDDAGAHEIDDGLSVGNTDQRIWKVYIHIADPASSVTLQDPLIQHAYRQTSTAYYPENVIPLFPKWFTNSLGLVSDGKPRRCLTFEIDYDSKTKKFDTENMVVSPRVANKIVQITYDEVDEIILRNDHQDKAVLKDISNLHTVATAFSEFRFGSGALGMTLQRPTVKLLNYPGSESNPAGKPLPIKIDVAVNKASTSRDIVAELMILCNHATAIYTKQRNISGMYRTQSINLATPEAEKQFLEISARQQMKKFGQGLGKSLDTKDSLSLLNRIRAAGLSVDPQPHAALGLDLYSQNTSPLRRFQDVLTHWQIENFLLNDTKAMFGTSQMDTMSVRLMRNQSLLKRASWQSNNFWTLRKIEQIASSHKHLEFDCIVTSPAMGRVQNVYCTTWGISAQLEVKDGATPLKIGQEASCKLVSVDSPRLQLTLAPC